MDIIRTEAAASGRKKIALRAAAISVFIAEGSVALSLQTPADQPPRRRRSSADAETSN